MDTNKILLRANLYLSLVHNQVIFAPCVRKYPPLYPDDEESTFGTDEPITAMQLNSVPALLGNRLKATLLASSPEVLDDHEQLRQSFLHVPDKETLLREAAIIPRKPPLHIGVGERKHWVKDPVLLISMVNGYADFEAEYRLWFVHVTENQIDFLGRPPMSTGSRKLIKSSIQVDCSDLELGEHILRLQVND